jgi:hypothetical protein
MLKLEEERKAMEKERIQVDKPVDCMATAIEPESLTEKKMHIQNGRSRNGRSSKRQIT